MKACIVIPIYKVTPDEFETISFLQCLKVLHRYKICIVTYDSLDVSYYKNELQKSGLDFTFEYFEKDYFNDIAGYNRLLLSLNFYKRFAPYEYMLIYQLDAYVFRDELEEWCKKGYDYIGAPWFEDNKSHEEGAKLWAVGNGGFSLRKINAFIRLLNSNSNVYSLKYIVKQVVNKNVSVITALRMCILGYRNRINYLKSIWPDAEDLFYCLVLRDTKMKLRIPSVSTAFQFAFEQSPKYLFGLNNEKMPFGCHGWQKYSFESFWKKHIILND